MSLNTYVTLVDTDTVAIQNKTGVFLTTPAYIYNIHIQDLACKYFAERNICNSYTHCRYWSGYLAG